MILKQKFTGGNLLYRDLGPEFHVAFKETSPEEFLISANALFKDGDTDGFFKEKAFGFVSFEMGKHVEPLYKGFEYWILNPDGTIFLTLKN